MIGARIGIVKGIDVISLGQDRSTSDAGRRTGGPDIDLVLIGLTMLVTVPRVGWWMAMWEQRDLWFVGYAAAVVFDLAVLRLSYIWQRAASHRQRMVAGSGFIFFAACSGVFQMFYLVAQKASLLEAIPMAAIWPVALSFLALNKATQDEREERRDAARCRVSTVLSGSDDQASGVPSGRTAGWTDAQRTEALRLANSGRTVREIAAGLGVPRSTVGEWVKGQTSAPGLKQ